MSYDVHISAATALWEHLAARAWGQYQARGRGVLLLEHDQLQAAHSQLQDDTPITIEPDFLPATFIPRGDDFRHVLTTYDPERMVMLLVREADGSDTLLALECADRTSPAACFEAWRATL